MASRWSKGVDSGAGNEPPRLHRPARGECLPSPHHEVVRWKALVLRGVPGDKQEAKDFVVNLIGASVDACFYVQVKATLKGYVGSGPARKLRVKVSKRDVEKLKKAPGPAFVVGIDVASDRRGYVMAITETHTKGISGVPTKHPLNCRTLKALWKEVDDHWKSRQMTLRSSRF